MAKFSINGKVVEAPEGSLVIDACEANGIQVPRYCYHPALGNPGNCRLCIVEVEGAPKPMVSCRLPVKEGMIVKTDSDAAKRAQASSVELHLVNHPLDCPVCDQAGECGLQDYYMQSGRYKSEVREDKEHKRKRTQIGPHVMLDQERCILCTRCTRFTEKITKTHELGIFGRGHTETVDLAPGMTLDNAYSGNVVDLCPVGALTDKDFRYKVRVWYLEETPSICAGCSRGCSIDVHASTRPWHNDGKRIARFKPRYNKDVNGYWMCDEGRYGWGHLEQARLGRVRRLKPDPKDLPWEEAIVEVADALREGVAKKGAQGLAVVASGLLSNEDWAAVKELFVGDLKAGLLLYGPEPEQLGAEDDLLRRKEKVPNLRAAADLGLPASAAWDALKTGLESGKIWGVYILERDPAAAWGEKAAGLLAKASLVVYQSPEKGPCADAAHFRLPATAYVEEDGHFTNFEGKVQAYQAAVAPVGEARPDWSILASIRARLKAPAEAVR
jgi:NADH-quinone oxidoreductase subunit G